MLKRTTHWATREFHQFLLEREKLPFAWGTNDCCLFPADAIQSFTGEDLAAEFRGKYTDEASAFAVVRDVCSSLAPNDWQVTQRNVAYIAASWCAKKAGLVEWVDKEDKPAPLFAQRGDLVVVENGESVIAGVVHLNGRHVISVGHEGLLRLPMRAVKRAWRI